ncbi:MAG: heterodisulfide reductase-related iron-sulfur binding cluster [Gammaproteobacteria bacterium]
MQTHFSPAQLANPQVAESERILRACVHCGFCTATCPTYLLTGDELDSPRGRIYLAKDMLEKDRPADATTVKHLDRCLTCLACMTTCPSGVNYMHLVDHARQHIERTYQRPLADRLMRSMLAFVLPHTGRFRAALWAASLARPFRTLLPKRLQALLDAAGGARGGPPTTLTSAGRTESAVHNSTTARVQRAAAAAAAAAAPAAASAENKLTAAGTAHFASTNSTVSIKRVALLPGCVQPALRPEINEAAIRLLNRHGVEVVVAKGTGCCGALVHHLGREHAANEQAKADIDAWTREIEGGGLDAIIVTASGCGTMLKDYGFIFRNDTEYAAKAKRISSISRDVTEVLAQVLGESPAKQALSVEELKAESQFEAPATESRSVFAAASRGPVGPNGFGALGAAATSTAALGIRVAYHSACSLQHGQKLHAVGPDLLRKAGFTVLDVPEAHICCGSAGTYSMLQPEMSGQLRDRKARNIESLQPTVIATGNIGCMTQISQATAIPIIHTVELLDWATGGPRPGRLS